MAHVRTQNLAIHLVRVSERPFFIFTYVEKSGVQQKKIAQSKALLETDSHAHFHLIHPCGTLDL